MRKLWLLLKLISVFLLISSVNVNAQNIQLEAGGFSVIYSIGYEHTFKPFQGKTPFVRLGVGYIPLEDEKAYLIPFEMGIFLGEGNNHLELGLGVNTQLWRERYVSSSRFSRRYREPDYEVFNFMYRVGYRYQKPEGGFVFRAGFTPVFGWSDSDAHREEPSTVFTHFPWLGVSFGYAF